MKLWFKCRSDFLEESWTYRVAVAGFDPTFV